MVQTPSTKIGAASLLGLLVLGCGGSNRGMVEATPIPDGYPGFGYTNALYVGTLTATDAAGHTATGPIGVTVSTDGSVVDGYGVVPDEASAGTGDPLFDDYRIRKNPAFRSVVDAPLSPLGEDSGTTTATRSGRTLSLRFQGDNGLNATVRTTLDAPNLSPGKPEAGTYKGAEYSRSGQSGELQSSASAQGTVAADGAFDFTYIDGLNRGGEMRGRIASDGTISDLVVVNDGNVIGYTGSTVKAYGNAQDLTVAVNPSFNDGIYDGYRMVRTGP